MLYIFLVDPGQTLTFDINYAFQSVLSLKNVIQSDIKIPIEKQVLLVSGGTCLNNNLLKICSYSAGTDTNPIFLFNKSCVENLSIPLDEDYDIETSFNDIRERVESCLNMAPSFNTLKTRTQLAQYIDELSKQRLTLCTSTVHDQHLMQQAWAAVLANLEDNVTTFEQRAADLLKAFDDPRLEGRFRFYRQFLSEGPFGGLYDNSNDLIIENALHALSHLPSPIHEAYLHGPSSPSNPRESSPLSTTVNQNISTSHVNQKDGPNREGCSQQTAARPITENHTMLNWLESHIGTIMRYFPTKNYKTTCESREVSSSTIFTFPGHDNCPNIRSLLVSTRADLAQLHGNSRPLELENDKIIKVDKNGIEGIGYKEQQACAEKGTIENGNTVWSEVCETFRMESSVAADAAKNEAMKRIGGLENRLFGLERLLAEVKRLYQDQAELSRGFAQNLYQAQKEADSSVLPDLCSSHKRQLTLMLKHYGHIRELTHKALLAKRELATNIRSRLKWVCFVQRQLCTVEAKLSARSRMISGFEAKCRLLVDITLLPISIMLSSVETQRRGEFQILDEAVGNAWNAEITAIHRRESDKRTAYQRALIHNPLTSRILELMVTTTPGQVPVGMNQTTQTIATKPEFFNAPAPNDSVYASAVQMETKGEPVSKNHLHHCPANAKNHLISTDILESNKITNLTHPTFLDDIHAAATEIKYDCFQKPSTQWKSMFGVLDKSQFERLLNFYLYILHTKDVSSQLIPEQPVKKANHNENVINNNDITHLDLVSAPYPIIFNSPKKTSFIFDRLTFALFSKGSTLQDSKVTTADYRLKTLNTLLSSYKYNCLPRIPIQQTGKTVQKEVRNKVPGLYFQPVRRSFSCSQLINNHGRNKEANRCGETALSKSLYKLPSLPHINLSLTGNDGLLPANYFALSNKVKQLKLQCKDMATMLRPFLADTLVLDVKNMNKQILKAISIYTQALEADFQNRIKAIEQDYEERVRQRTIEMELKEAAFELRLDASTNTRPENITSHFTENNLICDMRLPAQAIHESQQQVLSVNLSDRSTASSINSSASSDELDKITPLFGGSMIYETDDVKIDQELIRNREELEAVKDAEIFRLLEQNARLEAQIADLRDRLEVFKCQQPNKSCEAFETVNREVRECKLLTTNQGNSSLQGLVKSETSNFNHATASKNSDTAQPEVRSKSELNRSTSNEETPPKGSITPLEEDDHDLGSYYFDDFDYGDGCLIHIKNHATNYINQDTVNLKSTTKIMEGGVAHEKENYQLRKNFDETSTKTSAIIPLYSLSTAQLLKDQTLPTSCSRIIDDNNETLAPELQISHQLPVDNCLLDSSRGIHSVHEIGVKQENKDNDHDGVTKTVEGDIVEGELDGSTTSLMFISSFEDHSLFLNSTSATDIPHSTATSAPREITRRLVSPNNGSIHKPNYQSKSIDLDVADKAQPFIEQNSLNRLDSMNMSPTIFPLNFYTILPQSPPFLSTSSSSQLSTEIELPTQGVKILSTKLRPPEAFDSETVSSVLLNKEIVNPMPITNYDLTRAIELQTKIFPSSTMAFGNLALLNYLEYCLINQTHEFIVPILYYYARDYVSSVRYKQHKAPYQQLQPPSPLHMSPTSLNPTHPDSLTNFGFDHAYDQGVYGSSPVARQTEESGFYDAFDSNSASFIESIVETSSVLCQPFNPESSSMVARSLVLMGNNETFFNNTTCNDNNTTMSIVPMSLFHSPNAKLASVLDLFRAVYTYYETCVDLLAPNENLITTNTTLNPELNSPDPLFSIGEALFISKYEVPKTQQLYLANLTKSNHVSDTPQPQNDPDQSRQPSVSSETSVVQKMQPLTSLSTSLMAVKSAIDIDLQQSIVELSQHPQPSNCTSCPPSRTSSPLGAFADGACVDISNVLTPTTKHSLVMSVVSPSSHEHIPIDTNGQHKITRSLSPLKTPKQHFPKIQIINLSIGDVCLFYRSPAHKNLYTALSLDRDNHFLHSDSYPNFPPILIAASSSLEDNVSPLPSLPYPNNPDVILGLIESKEYCLAKKHPNRFNLALGQKFYRVRAANILNYDVATRLSQKLQIESTMSAGRNLKQPTSIMSTLPNAYSLTIIPELKSRLHQFIQTLATNLL